jgi:thymidine phosphorylase
VSSAAHLLALSDLGVDEATARERAQAAIADGSALTAYGRWIEAQGGDADEAALPNARSVREVPAEREGYVRRIGAVRVGLAALRLGAGRRTKDDAIDHAVGVVCRAKRGDRVGAGEPLAEVHARDAGAADQAAADVAAAYDVGDEAPAVQPIVLEVLA